MQTNGMSFLQHTGVNWDSRQDKPNTGSRLNSVSIILCTRNRACKLGRTLEALRALKIPAGTDLELIVVDNGSTDETAQVCATFAENFPARLQRVFLPKLGLGRARNAGTRVACGEIIAFLDDDIFPEAHWLLVICREFSADPDLALISGRVELYNPADLPVSVRRHSERAEFRSLGDAFELATGCNFAIRRELIDRVGSFDPDFGVGGKFWSAEDADFFYRVWKAGGKVTYEPSLFVLHDHGRQSPQAGLKLRRDYLRGRGALYAKHMLGGDMQAVKAMYWELDNFSRGMLHRASRTYSRDPFWLLIGFSRYLLARSADIFRGNFWHYPDTTKPGGGRKNQVYR